MVLLLAWEGLYCSDAALGFLLVRILSSRWGIERGSSIFAVKDFYVVSVTRLVCFCGICGGKVLRFCNRLLSDLQVCYQVGHYPIPLSSKY